MTPLQRLMAAYEPLPQVKTGTVGYRYLEPEYADAFASGECIRIGTVASFQDLEEHADPLDSGVELNSGFHQFRGDATEADKAFMERFDVNIRGGGTVRNGTFNNNRVINRVPGYSICVCLRPDNPTFLTSKKTAVCQINDLRAFAFLLTDALGWRSTMPQVRPVRYAERTFLARDTPITPPASAFVKRPKFAPEEEVRIHWHRNAPAFIDAKVPALAESGLVIRIA